MNATATSGFVVHEISVPEPLCVRCGDSILPENLNNCRCCGQELCGQCLWDFGPHCSSCTPPVPDALPIILVDCREKRPLSFQNYPTRTTRLLSGDYGIEHFSSPQNPRIAIERKSLDDLVRSLSAERRRFMLEIERLRRFEFAAIVIEADRSDVEQHSYRSAMAPAAVLGSVDAITVRAGVHIFWAGDRDGAARQIESLVRQFTRGVERQFRLLSGAPRARRRCAS